MRNKFIQKSIVLCSFSCFAMLPNDAFAGTTVSLVAGLSAKSAYFLSAFESVDTTAPKILFYRPEEPKFQELTTEEWNRSVSGTDGTSADLLEFTFKTPEPQEFGFLQYEYFSDLNTTNTFFVLREQPVDPKIVVDILERGAIGCGESRDFLSIFRCYDIEVTSLSNRDTLESVAGDIPNNANLYSILSMCFPRLPDKFFAFVAVNPLIMSDGKHDVRLAAEHSRVNHNVPVEFVFLAPTRSSRVPTSERLGL